MLQAVEPDHNLPAPVASIGGVGELSQEEFEKWQHEQDSQYDGDLPWQKTPPAEGSTITGLVEVQEVEVSSACKSPTKSPTPACPPRDDQKKSQGVRDRKRKHLIEEPPQLPPAVAEAAKRQKTEVQAKSGTGSVEVSTEAQRNLKRKLEEDAKQLAEEKQNQAEAKKQAAADLALQKAQLKLEKAQAKAKALQDKMEKASKVKRKLDSELAAVADPESVQPPVSPPKKGRKPKSKASPNNKNKRDQVVKLSPKAKQFAASTSRPSESGEGTKSQLALQKLRDLDLPDLKLPLDPFCKKILAYTLMHMCRYDWCSCTYICKAFINKKHCVLSDVNYSSFEFLGASQ